MINLYILYTIQYNITLRFLSRDYNGDITFSFNVGKNKTPPKVGTSVRDIHNVSEDSPEPWAMHGVDEKSGLNFVRKCYGHFPVKVIADVSSVAFLLVSYKCPGQWIRSVEFKVPE